MTGVTPTAHVPFMEPTDPLKNVAASIQALAESTYDLRDALTFVNQTGFTVQRAYAQPILGDAFYWLYLDFTYTAAAAITADGTAATVPGNLADMPVCVLGPAAYRPPVELNGLSVSRPGFSQWFAQFKPDGTFSLTHGPTGGKFAQNATFTCRALIDRIG